MFNLKRFTLVVPFALAAASAFAQIERVSVANDGSQAAGDSYQASISDDGQVVAFRSNADGLAGGDSNGLPDIFVRDLGLGTTERISTEIGQNEQALYNRHSWTSISDDGMKVAYQATPSAFQTIRVFDRGDDSTVEILPLSPTPNNIDGEARQQPVLSGNGQWVAFYSTVTFQGSEPPSARPAPDDTNGAQDVFVYDLPTQQALRLSRNADGVQGNAASLRPSISDEGRFVVFESWADNLVPDDIDVKKSDVFVKDRISSAIVQVSVSAAGVEADEDSEEAAISGDGNWIAFRSRAGNLVPGDTNGRWDIFVRDRSLTVIERISVTSDGEQSNRDSFSPSLSDDGRFVAFHSSADNLVPDDANQRSDVFVHDRQTGLTALVSRNGQGEPADGHSTGATISGDGQWLVFESDATDLVDGDTNRARDIFLAPNPLGADP
ncbi:MAG: hypothetical protein V2J10_13145 [Wenzhouxiangella sp.]|jgi:Tol biopolymer transport system component|nr:hypothetical protein [Wenzhouxiangella sp.]